MADSDHPSSESNTLNSSKEAGTLLNFPAEVGGTNGMRHTMIINIYEEDRTILADNISKIPVRSITLPMPIGGLADQQQFAYTDDEYYQIYSAATNVHSLKDLVDFGVSAGKSVVLENAAMIGAGVIESAAKVGVILPNTNAISRDRVGAYNPRLKNNFQAIGFKEHQFTWNLIPRSYEEAIDLFEIISCFKYYASPAFGEFYYGNPAIFDINFNQPEYMYNIGDCYMTAFSVIYNPSGVQKFFNVEGVSIPAEVQMNLMFKERNIKTRNQFADFEVPVGEQKDKVKTASLMPEDQTTSSRTPIVVSGANRQPITGNTSADLVGVPQPKPSGAGSAGFQ